MQARERLVIANDDSASSSASAEESVAADCNFSDLTSLLPVGVRTPGAIGILVSGRLLGILVAQSDYTC